MKKNHLAEARKSQKAKEEKIRVVSSLKQAMIEIETLEAQVRAIQELKSSNLETIIRPRMGENKSEAVAFAIATDWHLGSIVDKKMVNGLNEYNVAIAKKRIVRFFENVVSLTNKERQNVSITELVLFLGGDL